MKGRFSSSTRTAGWAAGVLLAAAMCFSALGAAAQPVQDSLMSQQERARSLESDIGRLEARLAQVQEDSVTISIRLSEIEKHIVACHVEIEAAEAEVDDARRALNSRLRRLYIDGRQDTLALLVGSEDASDFMAWLEYVTRTASHDAEAYRRLRSKKRNLEDCRQKLQEYKSEAAKLSANADTRAIQDEIEAKKAELAFVASALIAAQLPSTYAPAPVAFDPSRVYARPEENGFTRTGQTFSGYASWYGSASDGKPTASGEMFDQYAFTCAHRNLPFGTWLRVTFRDRVVIVKVNDRGPEAKGRILDLSRGAAEAIGLTGVQWIDCELVVPRI